MAELPCSSPDSPGLTINNFTIYVVCIWMSLTLIRPCTIKMWSMEVVMMELVIKNTVLLYCFLRVPTDLLDFYLLFIGRWLRLQNVSTWRSWRLGNRSCSLMRCCCLRMSCMTMESQWSVSKLWVLVLFQTAYTNDSNPWFQHLLSESMACDLTLHSNSLNEKCFVKVTHSIKSCVSCSCYRGWCPLVSSCCCASFYEWTGYWLG